MTRTFGRARTGKPSRDRFDDPRACTPLPPPIPPDSPHRAVDVDLQSITFYPNLLEDEWTRHVGRFKPYLSATIDQEKSTRVEMSQDIAKGLDFTSAGECKRVNGLTADRRRG